VGLYVSGFDCIGYACYKAYKDSITVDVTGDWRSQGDPDGSAFGTIPSWPFGSELSETRAAADRAQDTFVARRRAHD